MQISYSMDRAVDFLKDNGTIFLLAGIALIPTALYFILDSQGLNVPFFIKAIAITNWVKAVVGVGLGVFIGMAINNSKIGKD